MARPYDAQLDLARLAARVRGRLPLDLPSLFVMTDPGRMPDLIDLAQSLAPGTGLVYRHFGAPDRLEMGLKLAAIARDHGLTLLVSADTDLADLVGADGIHWPERWIGRASSRRMRGDQRLFTAAAHSPAAALRAKVAGIDAVFHSTIFASQSPSAGRPHGVHAAAALAQAAQMAVYPLGGVNERTGRRLIGLGFAGFCCVGAAAEV